VCKAFRSVIRRSGKREAGGFVVIRGKRGAGCGVRGAEACIVLCFRALGSKAGGRGERNMGNGKCGPPAARYKWPTSGGR
jgi:hypothetical protein